MNEVAKRHGLSEQSIYGWRKRFGEFNMDYVKRIKALEVEDVGRRRLLVERDREIEVTRDVNNRKW